MKIFSKKHIYKTLFALLTVLLGCLAACEIGGVEDVNCLKLPFSATVEGDVDGVKVKADVFCDPTEHLTKEIYNVMTVTFYAPESMDGITVSLRSDNKATVRLKNTEDEKPLYEKIIEPYLTLMPRAEYSTVEKTDDGFKIVYNADGCDLVYIFDEDGIPKSIEGEVRSRKVRLDIIKFDQKGN